MTLRKKDLRPQPRWWQHIKAILGGYFWLPCPICNEYYGGHEPGGELYKGGGSGWGVCANCVDEAQKLSDRVWKLEGVIEIDGRKL